MILVGRAARTNPIHKSLLSLPPPPLLFFFFPLSTGICSAVACAIVPLLIVPQYVITLSPLLEDEEATAAATPLLFSDTKLSSAEVSGETERAAAQAQARAARERRRSMQRLVSLVSTRSGSVTAVETTSVDLEEAGMELTLVCVKATNCAKSPTQVLSLIHI